MIYLAVLSHYEMERRDFLKLIGHNPQFRNVRFDGTCALAESTQPEGMMRRYVWKMNDNNMTTNDLTVVISFNDSKVERDEFSAMQHYKKYRTQVDSYLDWLMGLFKPTLTEQFTTVEGNYLYMMRNCDFERANDIFAAHERKNFRSVV